MPLHLRNDHLVLAISERSGAILQVTLADSGLQLLRAEHDLPPWELSFIDPTTGVVEVWKTWERFTATTARLEDGGERADLRWELAPGLTITARVTLPGGSPNASLHVAVHNRTERAIRHLTFPVLRGIGRLVDARPEDNLLLHPVAGGFLFVDPYRTFADWPPTHGLRHIAYPTGAGAFTQFMAYYAREVGGFYLACHDPWNTAKELDFFWSPEHEGLEARIAHKSWDVRPGNALILEYPIVLGALAEGNWYEAAERYRAWATATGEGHPDWCGAGRLEERVAQGRAARWLVEEVGFATFGLPSSFDVSPWLEAFHRIAERPVFHVLGHDWPQWGGATTKVTERLDALFQEAGLKPYREHTVSELGAALMALPPERIGTEEGCRQFFERLGADWSRLPPERWREIFAQLHRCGPWFPPDTPPLSWFPARFHRRNLAAIRESGDRFAPFLFDFFAYGHDVREHGLVRGPMTGWLHPMREDLAAFARIWMDPCTAFWQDFHARRDRQLVAESGADAVYYDISAGCGPDWSDRADHGHPRGYGRWLWEGYAEIYRKSREAASAERGNYVALGAEMVVENLIRHVDFAQWRAGGLVQGDLELLPILPLMKVGRARKVPLFSYLYHEYGPVILDGWAKLSRAFGDIFYLIAAQVALQQGGLVELNYEYSPLERFPGMTGPTYQLLYNCAIREERSPHEVDEGKLAFLREIALARTGFARRYLAYGKAARPVRFTTPIPQMRFSWQHENSHSGRREGGRYLAPVVVHQAWLYRDHSLGLLFVNLDDSRPLSVEFVVDPEKCGLAGGAYTVWRVTREEREKLRDWDGRAPLHLSVRLPPREIVLIEIE